MIRFFFLLSVRNKLLTKLLLGTDKMPQLKLIYLNVRGLGEVPRLVMHYADADYEDVRLDREQWMEMKSRKYHPPEGVHEI